MIRIVTPAVDHEVEQPRESIVEVIAAEVVEPAGVLVALLEQADPLLRPETMGERRVVDREVETATGDRPLRGRSKLADDRAANWISERVERLGFTSIWLGSANGDLELPRRIPDSTSTIVVGTSIVDVWQYPSRGRCQSATPGGSVPGALRARPRCRPCAGEYSEPLAKLGEYLDLLDGVEHVAPDDRRMMIAALGPRALRRSAERSAGTIPHLVTPEYTAVARAQLGAGALMITEQKVYLGADLVVAGAAARRSLAIYLQLPNYLNNLRKYGFDDSDFADGGSDRFVAVSSAGAMLRWCGLASQPISTPVPTRSCCKCCRTAHLDPAHRGMAGRRGSVGMNRRPSTCLNSGMEAALLVESLTGNTWKAAELVGAKLQEAGWGITGLSRVREPDHHSIQRADLVLVGTWTHGLFVVGQAPWGVSALAALPAMRGKKAAVFCTFALNPAKTLDKMTSVIAGRGADVIGGFAMNRRHLDRNAEEFAARLVDVTPALV